MDYNEDKIRAQVIAGLKTPEPWRVELEAINYGEKLGVFYRAIDGIKRVSVDTRGKTDDQIAFGLLSELMNRPIPVEEFAEVTPAAWTALSPYEGKRGKHPNACTCSKHIRAHGSQAA